MVTCVVTNLRVLFLVQFKFMLCKKINAYDGCITTFATATQKWGM